jgi:hypothetical protein
MQYQYESEKTLQAVLTESPPPRRPFSESSQMQSLNGDSLRNIERYAILIPLLSFVIFLIPSDLKLDQNLGGVKITSLQTGFSGAKAVLTLAIGIMLVRVTREYNRLV